MGKGVQNNANGVESHPDAFPVSGPTNCSSSIWKDLFNSSWKDENYKRTVMACFVQGAYLHEEDRVANRTEEEALAPGWWLPFKYKLTQTLIDTGNGSIFGVVLEWAGFVRPRDAPIAVVAIRGTMTTKWSNFVRDMKDNIRLFTLTSKSLEGSPKFTPALNALKLLVKNHGSDNICLAGHSLGAGYGLQIGKTLSENGTFVETHLFNPPWVTLPIHDKILLFQRLVSWVKAEVVGPSEKRVGHDWVPHFYVNDGDVICKKFADPGWRGCIGDGFTFDMAAKLFILKAERRHDYLQAHSLEQWWTNGMNLKLIEWKVDS